MKLYHTTLKLHAESIQKTGFIDSRGGDYCDGGIWFSSEPYWEEAVFTEGPRSEYGYFAIDADESEVEEYKTQNEALECPEWEIPFEIANAHFSERAFHSFPD